MFNTRVKSSDLIILISLAILGFALYGWGVNAPFQYDDNYNILKNNFIHDLRYFFQYFTDPRTHSVLPENAPYRPLSTLIYALLWAIGGGSTISFHIYKIILHVLAAWLGFSIYKKILTPQRENLNALVFALVGAVIFLIHPANSETVNYISSNSTLQCSVLYLAAFYFFLHEKYFVMALLFAGALLTKEEGATFPAVLALYGLVFNKGKINIKAVVIAASVLLAYLCLYLSMPKTVVFSDISSLTYLFTQFRAWVKYLFWIFLPIDFSIEHKGFGFSSSFWSIEVIGSLAFSLFVLGLTLFLLYRKRHSLKITHRILCFGILCFYLVMLPSSSVFALFEPMNEHRYYLSYAFLIPAMMIFLGGFYNTKYKKIFIACGVGVGIALTGLTLREVVIWQTTMGVWQNAVEKDPENGRAYLNLGVQYLNQGRNDEAIENFYQCLKYDPRYAYCSLNMGIAWGNKNELDQAERYLAQAVEWDPNLILALSRYGEFLIVQRQQYALGLQMLNDCQQKSGGNLNQCYSGKSLALRSLGRLDEALLVAREVVRLDPSNRMSNFEVGLTFIALNRFDEAYQVYAELWQKDVNDVQSLHNLAWIEMQRHNWVHAKELWFEKLKLVSNDPPTWQQLKIVAENLNDRELLDQANKQLK